jgi:ribosomal protein S18 acetylase RimI-like enzyme
VIELSDVYRVTGSQIESLGEILTRAFQFDPLYEHFFPNESERKLLLSKQFRFFIRYGILNGEVYATSPNLEGVAIWLPPEKAKISNWRIILSGGLSLFHFYLSIGWKALSKMISYTKYANEIHDNLIHTPHWYLFLIGIDPVYQRKGYANTLMNPMLKIVDEQQVPCYLETQNKKNIPIFQHFGFKVINKSNIPKTNIGHWSMLREKS